MRLALGAGPVRLVRQLLLESVVLAACGGAVGLILAQWATRLLITSLSSGRAPIALDVGIDYRVLAFTATIAVATGVLSTC